MDDLKSKIAKLEKEKVEHEQNTNKVIEQLTLLNFQKDDQLQTMTSDITLMNNSMSTQSDELDSSSSKKKRKEKASKNEKKLKESIEKLESEVNQLKIEIRDQNSTINQYKRKETKWTESEQEFIKRIYVLQEFMIRSHSVINRRAAKHMRSLKKAMNLDTKIFDTLMQKQEWSLKLDENKQQLTN